MLFARHAARAQLLAAGCPGDPVVEAVASSLPASAASAGLPTLQQLQQRFGGVAQAAAEAAYFAGDDAEGGLLAHLVAKAAVKLKVRRHSWGAQLGCGWRGLLQQQPAAAVAFKINARAAALLGCLRRWTSASRRAAAGRTCRSQR